MPDGTGGVATGLYWVATGKMPIDDLNDDDDDPKKEPDADGSGSKDPRNQKDRKVRR